MALSIGELVGYIDLDASAAESTADKLGGFLEGKGAGWAKILGGVGLAGGVAFGASLSGAMGKEVTLDKLSASLGLSEAESERIGGVAGSLYANAYGESLDEVSTAVGHVMKNIDGMATASSKDLEGITAKVMDVATAFDQDLGMTTAAVGQMIRTGMAKDANEALDILTKGLQGPANKADDLMETMNEYGTQFRNLGLSGKDAMGLLSQGLQGGARDADIVADALKEFSLLSTGELTKMTKTVDGPKASLTALGEAFKAAGYDALDGNKGMQKAAELQEAIAAGGEGARDGLQIMLDGLRGTKNPLEQSRNAVALFGTQAEDMGDALYALDLDSSAKEIGKVGGAAEDMGKTLNDNASANITGFKRKLQAGFVDMIGGKVLPVVTDITGALNTGLGPAVSMVTDFLGKHSAVVGPIAAMLGAMAGGAMLVIGAIKVWTTVQAALNAVMALNPIVLVVLAIAGLVAGLVYAYKKSETFRDIVNGAFTAVKDIAGGVLTWLGDTVGATIDWIRDHWKLLLAILGGPLGLAVALVTKHWDSIKTKTGNAIDNVVDFVKGIPGRFTSALSTLAETVRGLFRDAMDAGKEKVTGIGGTIVSWIEGVPGKILEKLGAFKSAGRDLLQGFVDGMKNAAGVIEGIAGNVWDSVKGLINGAIAKINTALEFTIDLPGPKDVTINPPNIPQLATGGRATAATLAVIGEGREPESVLPDSVLRGLLERAHAAGAAQGNGRGGGPMIGTVYATPGMSADELAERLWFKTRTRG